MKHVACLKRWKNVNDCEKFDFLCEDFFWPLSGDQLYFEGWMSMLETSVFVPVSHSVIEVMVEDLLILF